MAAELRRLREIREQDRAPGVLLDRAEEALINREPLPLLRGRQTDANRAKDEKDQEHDRRKHRDPPDPAQKVGRPLQPTCRVAAGQI